MRRGLSGLAVLFIITTFLAAGVAGYEYNQYNQLNIKYNAVSEKYHVMSNRYQPLNKTYNKLLAEYNSLKNQYTNISTSYSNLQDKYTGLENDYHKQVDKYNSLYENYTKLVSQWNELVNQWNSLVDEYNNLTTNYDAWYEYAWSVISFTNETISRIYSQEQLNYLNSIIVNNVSLTNPSDWWLSIYELYQYENKTVKYAYDEPVPEPPWIQDLMNGTYKNETFDNSYMSPNETLSYKQGDCDDQAILLYGLINTYEKYILRSDQVEWLVYIGFNDGSGHMTVFIPIQGGKLTIMDPAGQYLTLNQNGQLTANNALQELQKYSDYWNSDGGIKYIELYEIHGDKAYMVANGTIYDIADYISSVT